MSGLKIRNNPIDLILKAFAELWPEKKVDIYFDPDLPRPTAADLDERDFSIIAQEEIASVGAAGATKFEDGKKPTVYLNPDQPFMQLVQTLAEELAHVVAGPDAGHGPEFGKALDLLSIRYEEIMQEQEAGRT